MVQQRMRLMIFNQIHATNVIIFQPLPYKKNF
jgi:hypothetical protein